MRKRGYGLLPPTQNVHTGQPVVARLGDQDAAGIRGISRHRMRCVQTATADQVAPSQPSALDTARAVEGAVLGVAHLAMGTIQDHDPITGPQRGLEQPPMILQQQLHLA